MVRKIDRDALSADELYDWCMVKYRTRNPLSRALLGGYYRALERLLARLEPGARVLEVGCGAGQSSLRLAAMLAEQSFEVSDVEDRYVGKLEQSGFPLKITRESVYDLQRADGELDCVLLLQVLEHLEDYEHALEELFRVSRRYVLVSVPREPLWRILNMARGKYWSSWGNIQTHVNHWSARGFEALIARHGRVAAVATPIPWTIVLAEVRR